jgi:hypothetical protein
MITPKIPNTQESIKIIKEAQGWLSLNESYGDTYITIDQPLSAALVQAIIALQKQIPVPPILIDQTVESYANVQCPSCNRKFQIGKVSKWTNCLIVAIAAWLLTTSPRTSAGIARKPLIGAIRNDYL